MVVTDTNGEDVFVVMGLDQYEDLVLPVDIEDGSGEGEDWDEEWWNAGKPDDFPPIGPSLDDGQAAVPDIDPSPSIQESPKNLWEVMQPAGDEGETWDIGKMSDGEKADLERQFAEYQKIKALESGEKVAMKSAEVVEVKKDEEFGEEQFYLEPIE